MKKIVALVVCLCLFTAYNPVKVYAEGTSITQNIEIAYYKFLRQEKVAKIMKSINSGWKSFKNWVANLPGIREYNASEYAGDNWKKTMSSMGDEYNPHLKKNGASANLLKKGKQKWDKM